MPLDALPRPAFGRASARRLRLALARALAAAALLLGPGAALAASDGPSAPLRVGSKRFTESYVLAHLVAEAARGAGPVEVRDGLGNTAITYEALRAGEIDLYPEYTGTIALEILRLPRPVPLDELGRRLAPLGLGLAVPFGFNDGYALAMREPRAAELHVRTVSDLARWPALRPGLTHEFMGRADGWTGLAAAYHLPQRPRGLDHGLAYDALSAGQVDVIDIYTTDARIAPLGLRVLQDDRGWFPRYDAVLLYRLDVPRRHPAAWAAIQRLAGRIDERAMIDMNGRAELRGESFAGIARDAWRRLDAGAAASSATASASSPAPARPAASASSTAPATFMDRLLGPDLPRLTWQHLALVVAAVGLATVLGVPLAVAVADRPRARALLLATAGLLQTVPSLALLAALISALGRIGTAPALVALALYALLPIVRNTVTGLAQVPDGLRQAAQALGFTRAQRRRLVELPLARPVIVAGVRTATTIAVGTATLAAFIGAGGYGERIVTGLALNDPALMLAGALPAAALALACEGVFAWVERRSTPRGAAVEGPARRSVDRAVGRGRGR